MFHTSHFLLLLSASSSGLIAGLFYGYACSVNLGLGLLPDSEYLQAMQAINRAILNLVFFLSFMGTLILLPTTCYVLYKASLHTSFYCLLIASALYVIGSFGVTIFGNVPLNEALANFDIGNSSLSEIAQKRLQFEMPWNRLHLIRTGSSILAFALVVFGCLNTKN